MEPTSPIFVVGTMRSGSTLLRLVLDSHPHISIGPESAFMKAVAATKSIPYWNYGEGWYKQFNWSEAEFNEHLRRFYSEVFRRYATEQGKRRWGEKTPLHAWHVREMAQIFPDAVFVVIIRHPAAVALSLRKWRYDLAEGAREWSDVNAELLHASAELEPDRVVACRFEDLVQEPAQLLRELLDFLGEPWSDDVMNHARVQREKGASKRVEGKTRTRREIDPAAVDRWRRELTDGELEVVAAPTEALATRLGYVIDEPMPRSLTDLPVRHGAPNRRQYLLAHDDFRQLAAETPTPTTASEDDEALSEEEVRRRLRHAESALRRLRRRRAVRWSDALGRARRRGAIESLRGTLGSSRK